MHCNKLITSFQFPSKTIQLPFALAILILLSACTSSNIGDGLRPDASIGKEITTSQNTIQPDLTNSAPNGVKPTTNATTLSAANSTISNSSALAATTDATTPSPPPSPGVVFLPVVGPPPSAVTALTKAVKNSAATNAVTIIPNGHAGATYQVKGYFSALDDGSGTILVFVWDILDASSKTVHRISGEKRTRSRKSDPWSAIDTGMIDNIVAQTMLNLRGWMNSRA